MAAGKHKKTPKRSTFQKDSAAQTSSLRRIRVPAANQFPLVSETSSIGMHRLAHSPHTRQQEADGVATGPCRFVSMVTAPLLLLLLLQSITNQLTPSCEPALSADHQNGSLDQSLPEGSLAVGPNSSSRYNRPPSISSRPTSRLLFPGGPRWARRPPSPSSGPVAFASAPCPWS